MNDELKKADEVVRAMRDYASDCDACCDCFRCDFACVCGKFDYNAPKIIADLIESLTAQLIESQRREQAARPAGRERRSGMSIDLEAISARAGAATRGPWKVMEQGNTVPSLQVVNEVLWENPKQIKVCSSISPKREADADFIAHAREDVPALLAEVERLTAENEAMQSDVRHAEELDEQLASVTAERDALKERTRWIPATDRMPIRETNCIVCQGAFVNTAHYYPDTRQFCVDGYPFSDIDYWMQLPEAPKEDE